MMDFSTWRSSSLISQYFNSLLEFSEDESLNKLVTEIQLGSNYGFVLRMKDLLTIQDQGFFSQFILEQLKSIGYQINQSANGKHHLQASVKERVAGNQLYGTIRIIEKKDEIQMLITPYSDRQYNIAGNRKELFRFLFS